MGLAKRRKFWGWGFEGEGLDEDERQRLRRAVAQRYGVSDLEGVTVPRVDEIELPPSRLRPPESLAALISTDPHERLLHSYGRSFPDSVRIFRRHFPRPPDAVAFPGREEDVLHLLEWADGARVAVIPYGGGSSVCGGVEPDVGEGYTGTLSLDLGRLDRVVEIDEESRAARIQAGIRGPDLEAALKPRGLTLRHFPQSFEHSTLGGWIATRSGGHFATLYTHIDDFVESTRMVTPRGIMESRRLPGSGAGPRPDGLVMGSEGTLGVISEAWMRLQARPTHRASAAVFFSRFEAGAQAVRMLSQAGLYPSNCRLIDAAEASAAGASGGPGDGVSAGDYALLVLGFESADHPLDAWMTRAREVVEDCGGQVQASVGKGQDGHRSGAAGDWRRAFLRAPYAREVLVPLGVIADTFETAITWDRFADFRREIQDEMRRVIQEVTGRPGSITCRFTHVYPDGPAPYFTFQGLGRFSSSLEQWREVKAAANELVVRLGGTITHHHAVGRDHRPGYDRERPPLFASALQAAKAALDPNGILNPGVLIDPQGRAPSLTGVMAG